MPSTRAGGKERGGQGVPVFFRHKQSSWRTFFRIPIQKELPRGWGFRKASTLGTRSTPHVAVYYAVDNMASSAYTSGIMFRRLMWSSEGLWRRVWYFDVHAYTPQGQGKSQFLLLPSHSKGKKKKKKKHATTSAKSRVWNLLTSASPFTLHSSPAIASRRVHSIAASCLAFWQDF